MKILNDFKELLKEPYYLPWMVLFVFLGYQAWNGGPSPFYTPFLILGVIIYIPFAITLCMTNGLISEYIGIDRSLSSIITCHDFTEPQIPLLILILAIEYSIIYLVIRAIIRALWNEKKVE